MAQKLRSIEINFKKQLNEKEFMLQKMTDEAKRSTEKYNSTV